MWQCKKKKKNKKPKKVIFLKSLPGKLFCLYPEEFTYKEMKSHLPAKIQESNLTSMVLFLKRMDIAGFRHCDFISRPGNEDAPIFHIFIIIFAVI